MIDPNDLPDLEIANVRKKGRHYLCPDGKLRVSVTEGLSVLDKPALHWWGASEERNMVVDYAVDEYATLTPGAIVEASVFRERLLAHLPRQQARFRKSKDATDIGSEVHDLIQHRCREMMGRDPGPRPKVTTVKVKNAKGEEEEIEPAEIAFMAWEDWAEKVNLEPLCIEKSVYSYRLDAAGTMDLFGIQDYPEPGVRRHCVYDWKSSSTSKTAPNGIYPESLIQVATYAQMLVELGAAPESTMACIVRLPKKLDDPMFETGEVDHVEILPDTRRQLAAGFENIRKSWTFMKGLQNG